MLPAGVTVSFARAAHALLTGSRNDFESSQPCVNPTDSAYTVIAEPEVSRNVLLSFTNYRIGLAGRCGCT